MKNFKSFTIFLLLSSTLFTGCASLQNSGSRALNDWSNKPAFATCYSGGKVIYQGRTKSKPLSEQGSDGYFFEDKEGTVETNGDCVFRYDK